MSLLINEGFVVMEFFREVEVFAVLEKLGSPAIFAVFSVFAVFTLFEGIVKSGSFGVFRALDLPIWTRLKVIIGFSSSYQL